jgi:hypothetical protein
VNHGTIPALFERQQQPSDLTIGHLQPLGSLHLRQMPLLYLVQHPQSLPFLLAQAIRSVSMDPQPSMKADIPTLLKPDILTLQLHGV